jgi:phage terminase Nu1 subunit (DNA packaging protein)
MSEHMSRNGFQRATGRPRHEVERLLAMGLPHETVGSGRGLTVQIDVRRALAWFASRLLDGDPDEAGGLDLNAERARLAKEQADHAALKNAMLRGELLDANDVVAGWQDATARARSLLLGLPPACADEVTLLARSGGPRAVRDFLADRIHDALTELANTDDLDADQDADRSADQDADEPAA